MQPGPVGGRECQETEQKASEKQRKPGGGERSRARGREGSKTRGGAERSRARGGRERRAASEGGDVSEESTRLRWRLNQLERDKLQLSSLHNQQICQLQTEVTRLRSAVERGEAQRAELQLQLTVSRRDAERSNELGKEKSLLTERVEELQQTVGELQKALSVTRRLREEEQEALQQEVEERDGLIHNFSSDNQRLHRLLQDQEAALEESERRRSEEQRERQRVEEVNRRQAEELNLLLEKEERSRREAQLSNETTKALEAERAAHLETKYTLDIVQLRLRELEASLVGERCSQQEAQQSLELLQSRFREVERAYSLERERRDSTERALERLQGELDACRADLTAAVETEKTQASKLSGKLEEERRRHAETQSLLEKESKTLSDTEEALRNSTQQIYDVLHQHRSAAEDDGKCSPAEVLKLLTETLSSFQQNLKDSNKQIQDLLRASGRLQEENRLLQQLSSDQQRQTEESRLAVLRLEEEVARVAQENSDWSKQNQLLQEQLLEEKEQRHREREEEQREKNQFNEAETARLSFLHCLYQRLLAGCVLLRQPQSILGDFTWEELCDVISEQAEQLTSDLQRARDEVSRLERVCERRSVCVRELQRNQEGVMSRLEAGVRRREEAWSHQLQLCRSECASLRGHASSLESRCSSLESHASSLESRCSSLESHASSLESHASSLESRCSSLESRCSSLESRCSSLSREASSFFSACVLLAGGLTHALGRARELSEQKRLLRRQLAEQEALEEEVRRLASALGGDEEEGGRSAARRRWRRSVCAVLALNRWRALGKHTRVVFRLEGGGASVCVGGDSKIWKSLNGAKKDGDPGRVCARWLRSKRLSSIILSSMSGLQEALERPGSSPQNVLFAARSGMLRLLDLLSDQSASSRDRSTEATPPQLSSKTLVSALQQHFLLFSQRLHSTEMERRSLRLEVASLKRERRERHDSDQMVAAERFHSVCEELRQALNREEEAQKLIREQSRQLQLDRQASERTSTEEKLQLASERLSDAQREVKKKERSLRILGKHLLGLQKERKQLEERLQRADRGLSEAVRWRNSVLRFIGAAETSLRQVRESLSQPQQSSPSQPRPLQDRLELSGAPEDAAFQGFVSALSQLCHAYSSRIDWLEREVSVHHRSELQDVCLHSNQADIPVKEFPESFAAPSI